MDNIVITFYCDHCKNEIHQDSRCFRTCDDCNDKESIEIAKRSILLIQKEKIGLKEYEKFYGGFETEEEKNIYMKGLKRGAFEAMYAIADYYDEIGFLNDITEQ